MPQYLNSIRATLERHGGYTVTQADRGENQREKPKVSPLPVSPYYTTLDHAQTHYLVCTDPTLCEPLTDSGCMYTSCFTFAVTLEVKVEQSSDLRAEWSSDVCSSDLAIPALYMPDIMAYTTLLSGSAQNNQTFRTPLLDKCFQGIKVIAM